MKEIVTVHTAFMKPDDAPEPALPELRLWNDPIPASGERQMAVDEWLAESQDIPVLRFYRWREGWGSFGCFVPLSSLPSGPEHWVRRWTGGGIVDHRSGWTYTLFIPRPHALATLSGAGSYRLIHHALAAALNEAGEPALLSAPTSSPPGGECFVRPVEHDVMNPSGLKLAGAGQRRTRRGLLHQGSVLSSMEIPGARFASLLAADVVVGSLQPPEAEIASLIENRYGNPSWNGRR